jgi:hypothetical protein
MRFNPSSLVQIGILTTIVVLAFVMQVAPFLLPFLKRQRIY